MKGYFIFNQSVFAKCDANMMNSKTPLINLKWHKRTIEAMNAVYESIATGKVIKL